MAKKARSKEKTSIYRPRTTLEASSAGADAAESPASTREPEAVVADTTMANPAGTVGWDARLGVLVLAILILVPMHWRVLDWLVMMWNTSPDYSHGYLIAPFTLYLLWGRRREIGQASPAGGLWVGLSMFLLAVLLRFGGVLTGVITLEAVSMIVMLTSVVAFLYGARGWWLALPPLAFLLFMVPPPGFIAGQLSGILQGIATTVSTFSLQTLGIPAFSSGNIISLSNGNIGVAEACSGLRMLYAFFALTVGAIFVINRTLVEKLLIAVLAIPIAIATNCIRIVATGMAFEYSTPEFAGKIFHDWAGWLMMPVGFVLLVLALSLLDKLIVPEESW